MRPSPAGRVIARRPPPPSLRGVLLVLLTLVCGAAWSGGVCVAAQSSEQRLATVEFLRLLAAALPVLEPQWVGTDYCAWSGVSCDADAVARVSLQNCSLAGQLPGLPQGTRWEAVLVTELDLSFNGGITGSLPPSWSGLAALQRLDVSYTSVGGAVPQEWGEGMAALVSLRASRTNLCPSLPAWTGMPSLVNVDFSYNARMTGSLPDSWATAGALPRLLRANLVGSAFCGCVPEMWRSRPELLALLPPAMSDPQQCMATTACRPDSNTCSAAATTPPPTIDDAGGGTAPVFPATDAHVASTRRFLVHFARDIPALTASWGAPRATRRAAAFSNADFCDWPGVRCDGDLGTVAVAVAGRDLRGTYSSLASATASDINASQVLLAALDVSDNPNLGGNFDPALASLPFLASVNLANTSLGGALPGEWGEMRSLQVLSVRDTAACGDLPAWATPSLVSADFTNARLGGSLADSWANMPHLAFLRLNGNGLCGCMPASWRRSDVLVSAVRSARPAMLLDEQQRCSAGACGSDSARACRAAPRNDAASRPPTPSPQLLVALAVLLPLLC